MATLGSKSRPIIIRVQDEARAKEVASICDQHGLQFILGIEPRQDRKLTRPKEGFKTRSAITTKTASQGQP